MKGFLLLLILIGALFPLDYEGAVIKIEEQGEPPSIYNCNMNSGPATLHTVLALDNPLKKQADAAYELYDFHTRTWNITGICHLDPSGAPRNCIINIPVILGGTGTGIITQDMVKVRLVDDVYNITYEKTFSIRFQHNELPAEANIKNKKAQLQAIINSMQAKKTCSGTVCCPVSQVVATMESRVEETDASLAACQLSSAYNNAVHYINEGNATLAIIDKCEAALASYESVLQQKSTVRCSVPEVDYAIAAIESKIKAGNYDVALDVRDAMAALAAAACPEENNTTENNISDNETTQLPLTQAPASGPCPAAFVLLALFFGMLLLGEKKWAF